MNEECKFSKRLDILVSLGFVKERACITNGKYSFLYHQLDTSEISDAQFEEFINIVKSELI